MKKDLKIQLLVNAHKGDLKEIHALIEKNKDDPQHRILCSRFKNRFIDRTEPLNIRCKNKFIKGIVRTYQIYYRLVFSKTVSEKRCEKFLLSELNDTILQYAIRETSFDNLEKIERFLAKEVKNHGYYGAFWKISPYRAGFIWRKEEVKTYNVELPLSIQRVRVIFISRFILNSWAHYLTFGKEDIGGWAANKELYCIKQLYNGESEKFKMWYLKHEAQHFADYKLFPNIKFESYAPENGAKLEYRAKLVELIYSRKPNQRMRIFIDIMKNSPLLPHPFGAYRLVKDIARELGQGEIKKSSDWKTISAALLSDTARTLLLNDKLVLKGK